MYGATEFEQPVARTVEEGLTRYIRRPRHYSDLPGYESLRNLGGHEEDTLIKPPQEEILVLCPFAAEYEKACLQKILHATREAFSDPDAVLGPAKRVVDMSSPETLLRRLYEGIRRDQVCVTDLTLERPNVFFELGVRLATNEHGARVTRCHDFKLSPNKESDDAGVWQSTGRIEALLGATSYSTKESLSGMKIALCLESERWPKGLIAPCFVHNVAQRCTEITEYLGGVDALDFLWESASNVSGAERSMQANYALLYIGNGALSKSARKFVFDMLLAYLLLARNAEVGTINRDRIKAAISDLKTLLRTLGTKLEEQEVWKKTIQELEQYYEHC